MSTAVATRKTGWSRAQVDLLKSQIAKGLTDDEFRLFGYICRRTGLDPFLRQIYAIKYYDTSSGGYRMVIQTGIDGFRLCSSRNPNYAGVSEPEFEEVAGDAYPKFAKVRVFKFVNDVKCEFVGVARWSEFAKKNKDGKYTGRWSDMPYNQLAKCAEAAAHRKAFPAEIAGLVAYEEMPAIDLDESAASSSSTPQGIFEVGQLYVGTVLAYVPCPGKKRPGSVVIAVPNIGETGPLTFFDDHESTDLQRGIEVVSELVQFSYTESSGKGRTYKNLSHFALVPDEAGPEPLEKSAADLYEAD